MEELGEVLGWFSAVCYFAAISDLFVKQFYKACASKLPQGSVSLRFCRFLMQRIVRYHRYFGMAAGVFALCHFAWQLVYARLSYTGVLVTALMAATVLFGLSVLKLKKKAPLRLHRLLALAVLVVLALHLLVKF